jgi:hypothetical protein
VLLCKIFKSLYKTIISRRKKMVKLFAILLLVMAVTLFAQDIPVEEGGLLTTGRTATLGIEASTAFAYDLINNSTGLQTRAGMELIMPLFPHADRGIYPTDTSEPAVRLALKNSAFTWLNIFQTRGGNYEQDDFNSWSVRPLVLTFDSFEADLVWMNYFFRIASSTTVFRTSKASLTSIFDDVMDARERWYVFWPMTRALWTADRYNIQQMPLLRRKLVRDYIDEDYRHMRTRMSGILAIGGEFDNFAFALKAASRYPGVATTDPVQPANIENAWLFGADLEFIPFENFKFEATGFAGINYEKTDVKKNPLNFGVSFEYRHIFNDRYFLTPKLGFDFAMDTATDDSSEWELGVALLFHTRGYNYLTSNRNLDWAEVIPVGASLSINMNQENETNLILSWFEPAGPDSMIPNFGGFLQIEAVDLFNHVSGLDYAALLQLEYMIGDKVVPYVRGGYRPEFRSGSNTTTTGNYIISGMVGCYFTPAHRFSVDVRYEMETLEGEITRNLISSIFTIKM